MPGTRPRTLDEVIDGADLFLGLSGPRRADARDGREDGRQADHLRAGQPDARDPARRGARGRRPDAIIATGRSDFPNQVNNVLCFPFIFRGALDVGATEINDAMQIACIEGIAALARATTSAEAAAAYRASS
jgi:malate dehydrogenase (oxaloacetate-decarboxylating)(NADP+)